jgi:hypothetical protein
MKKASKKPIEIDDMRDEYDFTNAKPNPYWKRYRRGTNVVLLDKDVAAAFPDSESVNTALRGLQQVMESLKSRTWRKRKR